MVSQSRKHRGYKTQRNVAQLLKDEGWENAHSIGAGAQGDDIQGVPFSIEVKAVRNLSIPALLKQLEARSTGLGFGVARLNNQGDDARKYAAIMRLEDLISLLKRAGWDKVKDTQPIRCSQCGSWMIEGLECKTCQNMITNVSNVEL